MKRNQTHIVAAFAAILSFAALPVPSAKAISIYTAGHGDIGAGYMGGAFEPHWHLHGSAVVDGTPLSVDTEFLPEELRASTDSTRLSPSGLSGAIGVPDGTLIYAMGSSTYPPNIGFGVEELEYDDWTTQIAVTLSAWTLPGATARVAMFTTNLGGGVEDTIFSTYAPGSTYFGNKFYLVPGDHAHFSWGFTEPGLYSLDLTWTGTHAIDGEVSTTETFSFEVVPEPATVVFLGMGLLALGATRPGRR